MGFVESSADLLISLMHFQDKLSRPLRRALGGALADITDSGARLVRSLPLSGSGLQ